MITAGPVADDMLRSFFNRWRRLEEEKQAISDDLKELNAEAKAQGFDTKAMRAVFRDMVKDRAAAEEYEAIYDLYWNSLNGIRAHPAHAHVENIEKFGADRAPKSGTVPAVSVSGNDSRGPEVSTPSAGASVEPLQPAPLLPAATDGSPGIPSSDADAGKNGGGGDPSPERVAEQAEHEHVQSEHAVTHSRAMSMTPLEPREAGGLKGFGFTVTFDEKPVEPTPNERCQRPEQCRFSHHPYKATCAPCSSAWSAARKVGVAA